MSIYRRRNPRTGKRSRFYTAEFSFRGRKYARSGFIDRDSARHWLTVEQHRLRHAASGYISPKLNAQVVPLIEQFAEHLRSVRRRDEMYCYTSEMRLKRLAGECGWLTLAHVTRQSLEAWQTNESLWRGKPITARTKNQYVQTATEWGQWLVKQSKLPANPFAGIELLPAAHNNAYRRAATVEELNALLAACAPERRLYYLFRIYQSGIRTRTLRQLTWRMLHLDSIPPFVQTPAEINKSRRDEKHPLRYDIAQQLRQQKKDTKARSDDLVFPKPATIRELKADLAAAGIPFDDGRGNRRLDFHALRRTLVRLAKSSGLSLDQASLLLGHRDPRTTRRYYDDDAIAPELGDTMERLPPLGQLRRAQ